jgi:hypothetical protein
MLEITYFFELGLTLTKPDTYKKKRSGRVEGRPVKHRVSRQAGQAEFKDFVLMDYP